MERPTSIIAALNAGKLPSTQQFNQFTDYLEHVGIVKFEDAKKEVAAEAPAGMEEATLELSAQGKILADDLRDVLSADKKLLNDKNEDNILQEAIWHLAQGTITTSGDATTTKKGAQQDIETVRQCLRTLSKALFHSFSSERSIFFADFLSLIRTSLSDALQVVEGTASQAKEGLRRMEGEVQEGKRDPWGRDKDRLEQERDPKIAWEHGVDTVKGVGSSVIGGVQGAQEGLERGQEKAEAEMKGRYYSIWKRAQSDPEYRQALDTLFSLLQDRLHAALDAADPTKKGDKNITLSTFITDPTPEQHIPKGINLLRTFFERLAGTSLGPVIDSVRNAMSEVLQDERLRVWFDEFFDYAKKVLKDVHYASNDEAKLKRKDLRGRWRSLTSAEENPKWHQLVEKVRTEWASFETALKEDADLMAVKESTEKLGEDMKMGLSERVAGRVEQAFEQITWFWQDLFRVYLPNILRQLKDLPIPRTEYKDDEIEFVLENLDISRLNLLPSRVYIRNITDVAIQTFEDPSVSADKQLATLTHIQLQALQMDVKDVSFWYKDKSATVMGEFTGLLGMKLPPQGINVDLKVRMIPAKAKGKMSRDEQRRFHVVERCTVEISDEVEVAVRESNHPMLVNVFSGVVKRRIKEAMERTLTGQFRALVDWLDRVAYDVGERRKVFEDAGLGGGPGVVAALWSELGKMEREAEEGGASMGIRATGTGLIFEERTEVPMTTTGGKDDKFEYEVGRKRTTERVLAIGVEPQVLSGEKRGPMGTGSESAAKTVEGMIGERGMDVDVEGAMKGVGQVFGERKKAVEERVEGFRRAVLRKEKEEKKSVGKTWKSDAFDF